jgi:hypothetical protein
MTMTHGEDGTPEHVVVLTGEHNGLDWKVVATWGPRSDPVEDRELMTMVHGFEGTKRVIGSGFGGPALYPGQLIHEWRGRTDQWRYFVMARADPTMDRIVVVTERGTEVELSQGVGAALGAQAGEDRLREIVIGAGFATLRRVAETPFNIVLEAKV